MVVCYDVADDRRRSRVHAILRDYGTPVQYSVFECVLPGRILEVLRRRVEGELALGDRVAYYDLCLRCRARRVRWEGRDGS